MYLEQRQVEVMQIGPAKVSVITVCRNSERTIAAALASVAGQTWTDVEHIVVDGASTDGTLAEIAPFQKGLAHLVSEPDRGIYDAMNKGLSRATGDIVCFLNSDDEYARPDVLERAAVLMQEHRFDIAFGDVAFFRAGDRARLVRRYNSALFHPSRLQFGLMPAHPALFVRRRVFEAVGAFQPSYRIAGDFEFVARAFQQPFIYGHIPEILVYMQLGGISTAGWRSRIELNREILRACHENGIKTNIVKLLSRYPIKVLEFLK